MRLVLAFAGIGLVAGFMVAASESPVVSAALPVLAGLVTAAITALSSRIDVGKAMQRVEALRDRLADGKTQVDDDAVAELVADHRSVVRHAEATTRMLGSLTLAFVVCFALGLGAGMWSRLDGVLAWAVSPLAGPWARPGVSADAGMPPSTSAALLWLALDQRLRQAGVPNDTIVALYEASHAEVAAAAKALAGDAEPTADQRRTAWAEWAPGDLSDAAGGSPGGTSIAMVGTLAVPRPGSIRREVEQFESLMAALAARIERFDVPTPPSWWDPRTPTEPEAPGSPGSLLSNMTRATNVLDAIGPVLTVTTAEAAIEVDLARLDAAGQAAVLQFVEGAGPYQVSVAVPSDGPAIDLSSAWRGAESVVVVETAGKRTAAWVGQDAAALADLMRMHGTE